MKALTRYATIVLSAGVAALAGGARSALAQGALPHVPLVRGLTIVSALHTAKGDRENVVTVVGADAQGVTYQWHFRAPAGSARNGPSEGTLRRFVRAADLARAPRLDGVFEGRTSGPSLGDGKPSVSPGFTAFSVSSATYERLRHGDTARYSITAVQGADGLGNALAGAPGNLGRMFVTKVTVRGTLAPVSTRPEPMSVLLNGRRVMLPALHLVGSFRYQDSPYDNEMWVLADSAHPLILRVATGTELFQTVRIDLPEESARLEQDLDADCRAELPGIYFDFASAELDPASGRALAEVARLLGRHGDWHVVIEGHTDSIGGAAANQTLSEQRAQAVRAALIQRFRVSPGQLRAVGFGATRPRESNATLEGRARNRRVELVRPCARQ